MSARPAFKLSRLRELGWALWNPIGLGPPYKSFADEYDGYLLQAAGQLWRAEPHERV